MAEETVNKENINTTTNNNSNEDDSSLDDGSEVSEYETIDLRDNEMYQVLSTLLENDEGVSISNVLTELSNEIKKSNRLMRKMLMALVSDN